MLVKNTLLSLTFAAAANTAAADVNCDPTNVEDVIDVAQVDNVEVTRSSSLTWVTLEPSAEDVIADALLIEPEGSACAVIVDQVRIWNGYGWRPLRIAGLNIFGTGYLQDRFVVTKMQLGLNLVLIQRGICSFKAKALIYSKTPSAMRPYPYPTPQC